MFTAGTASDPMWVLYFNEESRIASMVLVDMGVLKK